MFLGNSRLIICSGGWKLLQFCYLHRNGVAQPLDGNAVQLPVAQAPRAAPQHFSFSAAVQFISHFQLIWKSIFLQMKLYFFVIENILVLFSNLFMCLRKEMKLGDEYLS